MDKARFDWLRSGVFLLVAQGLMAQAPVVMADRQEQVFNGRLYRRVEAAPDFQPIPDYPELPALPAGVLRADLQWDGQQLYRTFQAESGTWETQVGSRFMADGGVWRWFWREPKVMTLGPSPFRVLGAQDNALLLLAAFPKANPSATPPTHGEWRHTLVRYDLETGSTRDLIELDGPGHSRATAVLHQGSFLVFTSAGTALRVDTGSETWATEVLTSTFWKEAGWTLCKDTGEYANPFRFGTAFLDGDGAILLPAQVFLPLNREDFERAWPKIPQARKADLIRDGLWPFSPDREVGWKDEACFIRFDPVQRRFSPVDRKRYAHLVVEKDHNFIVRVFKDFEPAWLYATDGGTIQRMGEALARWEAMRAAPPKAKDAVKAPSAE